MRRRLRWPKWRADARIDLPWELGEGIDDVVAAVGLLVALVVGILIFLMLPLVLFVLEALLVLGAVLIFRGTWIVEASTKWPMAEVRAWRVHGWGASKRAVDEVVRELRDSVEAAPAEGEPEPVGRDG